MASQLFIVDDNQSVRRNMARFLAGEPDLQICGEASSGPEALERLAGVRPDLVLIDVSMPGMNGIELVGELVKRYPELKCLMVSAHAQTDYAEEALRIGACGYVTKDEPLDVLEAIEQTLAGKIYVSPSISRRGA